jgi:hypothetical protein
MLIFPVLDLNPDPDPDPEKTDQDQEKQLFEMRNELFEYSLAIKYLKMFSKDCRFFQLHFSYAP